MSASQVVRTSKTFYPIINTLRALAVAAVVGYHAGLSFLPGGYVGVDVFFVISGFLIINHIIEEHKSGTFSFSSFYARRAIRILPPYFAVIFTCMIVAPFIFVLPSEFENFRDEVVWSSAMAANYLFLGQQGYFDASSNTKVLLHLWSLAVEEQFYLIAPITIACIWALSRKLQRNSSILLWSIFATSTFFASLILCIWFTDSSKNHAFYQMPLRAWEFIAGGAIALAVPSIRRCPSYLSDIILLVGLVFIGYAIGFYSHETPFPSIWAIPPVAGTCLAIAGGIARPNGVAKYLSPNPVHWIGLVSYSWYLWHWPALTFSRIYTFHEPSLTRDLIMSSLALGLAFMTYFLIEKPASNLRGKKPELMRSWWPTSIAVHVSCLIAVILVILTPQLAANVNADIPKGFIKQLKGWYSRDCSIEQGPASAKCGNAESFQSTGVLIGDSHAMALFGVLRKEAKKYNTRVLTIWNNGCPPLVNALVGNSSPKRQRQCENMMQNGLHQLSKLKTKPDFAILYARWDGYTYDGASLPADGFHRPLQPQPAQLNNLDPKSIFISTIRETIHSLSELGIHKILIIGPTPALSKDIPECLVRANRYRLDLNSTCGEIRTVIDDRHQNSISWIKEAIRHEKYVKLTDPIADFCDKDTCHAHKNMVALYFDDDHISEEGASLLLKNAGQKLQWAIDGRAR